MQYREFTLDKFQEDSVLELEKNNSVVVSAPTGSGKTLVADYVIEMDTKKGKNIIYTAPIKALSNQKYKEFSELFGKDKVGLLTGDITINQGAQIQIMTTEIFRNMAITGDSCLDKVSYVIFDEIHYINDIERGHIWEESIIFAPDHMRFLCLSATIPNADEFAEWIHSIKKDHIVKTIHHDVRYVPLHHSFYTRELGVSDLKEIKEIKDIPVQRKRRRGKKPERPEMPSHVELVNILKDKTPILFFTFSRLQCQKHAVEIAKKNFFRPDPEITRYVREKLADAPVEINRLESAKTLRMILPRGIGFHHAGLIPQMKEIVEGLFGMGKIKVLYTTETFAVGINMPAKTVCFDALRKYDGINFRYLNSKEYFQMAGRAGRRGIDKEGFVYSMLYLPNFEYAKVERFTSKDVEPLKSQFRIEVNAVINMEMQHSKEEIDRILTQSLYAFQNKEQGIRQIKATYAKLLKRLKSTGYLSQEGKVTWKGRFAASIFCDEVQISEVFSTDYYKNFSDYQILLYITCLVYEHRDKTRFYKRYPSKEMTDLKKKLKNHPILKADTRWRQMSKISAFVYPIMHGGDFFDILDLTNLLEGDIIRIYSQVLDRISQILKATDEPDLMMKMKRCRKIVEDCMKDISRI